MRLAGTIAVAGAVGVFVVAARGEDVAWRGKVSAAPPVKARAAAPSDGPEWKPARKSDPTWAPARLAPPQPIVEPIPTPPPLPELVLPVVDLQAQPPQPQPQPPTVPPLTIPPVVPPKKPEAAPPPRSAAPQMLPPPKPTDNRPAPKPDAGQPKAALTAVLPASATDVWGGYATCDSAACTVPVRHGTYGSPDLRLSRDYHVLDALARPFVGTEETVVLRDNASSADRFFVQAEYLLWWARQPNIPVLATTAANRQNGFLGQPGTTILLGPGRFGDDQRNGFRVRVGGWLNECATRGIDASYFFLGRQSDTVSIGSDRFPTILRPFFAPNLNGEFGELVAFPDLATGTLTVAQSSYLWGADVNLRQALCCECDRSLSAFIGYRYLNLHETLAIREDITAGPDAPNPAGTQIVVQDRFDTRNQFHGGQLGLAGGRRWGRVALDGRASIALGSTHQVVTINGSQVVTEPGGQPQSFTGGLLAAGPNLGRFTRDRFSVVPEATINLGYFVTPNLKAYIGYNFLFWSNVVRPGDQIDRVVDLTFVPNAPQVPFAANRPLPTFKQSDFWAHGLQFGLEFRW